MPCFFRFFFPVILSFFCANISAQQQFLLKGKIVSDDKEVMVSVNIFSQESQTGTYSDTDGNFQLQLPEGNHTILFSFIGYKTKTITVTLQRDTFISVVLKKSIVLNEVVITGKKKEEAIRQNETGEVVLHRSNITALPSVLGEPDLVKAVQMLPGVQSGNEGIGGIFVRGGSPDQNLILLDGATVFNPSHLYGFLSVFNSDILSSVTLHKNAYPAKFGGRLSSVLEIDTRPGDTTAVKGNVGIGIITSKAGIEGPFRNNKTNFNLAARGCHLGFISAPLSAKQLESQGYDGNVKYFFYDFNARIEHRFSPKTKLYLNTFVNNDFYKIKTGDSFTSVEFQKKTSTTKGLIWGNAATSLILENKISPKLLLTHMATYSRYLVRTSSDSKSSEAEYGMVYLNEYGKSAHSSVVNNISVRSDAVYTFSSKHLLNIGIENVLRAFQIGKLIREHLKPNGDTISKRNVPPLVLSNDISAYAEYELKPVYWWKFNAGIRLTGYSFSDFFKVYPQYRISTSFVPLDAISFRSSFSTGMQSLHMLTTASADVAVDYWVPATAAIQPQQSWQVAGGIFGKITKKIQWSIDAYYRNMHHLAEFKEGSTFKSAGANWQQQVAGGGNGFSYGGEFFVIKTGSRFTAQAAYTLQWSRRQFDNINRGIEYPFRYDRRHNIALAAAYKLNEKWDLSISWVYGSGNMFTMPTQYYHTLLGMEFSNLFAQLDGVAPDRSELTTAFNQRNSYRLPAFHHLDIGANYRWQKRKHAQLLNISIYNVYSRQNVFSVYFDFRYDNNGVGRLFLKQLSLFPVLPSVTYTVFFSK